MEVSHYIIPISVKNTRGALFIIDTDRGDRCLPTSFSLFAVRG